MHTFMVILHLKIKGGHLENESKSAEGEFWEIACYSEKNIDSKNNITGC